MELCDLSLLLPANRAGDGEGLDKDRPVSYIRDAELCTRLDIRQQSRLPCIPVTDIRLIGGSTSGNGKEKRRRPAPSSIPATYMF